MASTSKSGSSLVIDDAPDTSLEPGACSDSILNPKDSFEEFASEISSSLQERNKELSAKSSTISEIQNEIGESSKGATEIKTSKSSEHLQTKVDTLSASTSSCNLLEDSSENALDDYLQSPELVNKEKHVFILSTAGKPIYSRYGNEDKLAGLCGVIQALVSVVEDQNQDILRSINTKDCKAVFLVKGPLIMVAVSKSNESETQLVLQLTYAFNQIVSVLTLTQLTKIFEQRRNYDLRRLLSGAERLIDHLFIFMEKDPAFLLGAVRCLPLPINVRETITQCIISSCNKIRDLVFAILIAGNQLITLVRMKKYTLHPSDIHLLFNLVRSSESFKTAESWTPICLPKFDSTGFLHGHVSYLSEDCQSCLLLLTVQRDAFFPLSQAKHNITEKLQNTICLNAINDALNRKKDLQTSNPLLHIGVPEIRHFMYKSKSTAQLFTSDPITIDKSNYRQQYKEGGDVNTKLELHEQYIGNYRRFCNQIHCSSTPAKLIFKSDCEDTVLAWVTGAFELYVTFDPLMEKNQAILAVDKLLKWIKKEENNIFIMSAPTF